jgi:hypothetical protein
MSSITSDRPAPGKIAAANLSQLRCFLEPSGDKAFVEMPVGKGPRQIVIESLAVLGTVDIKTAHHAAFFQNHVDKPLEGECLKDPVLTLTIKNPILAQLISAGVSTPALDAYAGKGKIKGSGEWTGKGIA